MSGHERAAFTRSVLRGEITGEPPEGGWRDAFLAARAKGDQREAKAITDSAVLLLSAASNPDLSDQVFDLMYDELTAHHAITWKAHGSVRNGWRKAATVLLVK